MNKFTAENVDCRRQFRHQFTSHCCKKNALKVSATFSLSKVVEPSTSKPIEVEPDFSLDEVLSEFSVFQRSDEEFL